MRSPSSKWFWYGMLITVLATWSLYLSIELSLRVGPRQVHDMLISAWDILLIPAKIVAYMAGLQIYSPETGSVSFTGIIVISLTSALLWAIAFVAVLVFWAAATPAPSTPFAQIAASPSTLFTKRRTSWLRQIRTPLLAGFLIGTVITASVAIVAGNMSGDSGLLMILPWRLLTFPADVAAGLLRLNVPSFYDGPITLSSAIGLIVFNGALLSAFLAGVAALGRIAPESES